MNIVKHIFFGLAVCTLAGCSPSPNQEDNQNAQNEVSTMAVNPEFDWQGHRGARGLMPENTIPGFLKALEYPQLTTLELDVVITKDKQVVISHEPWMSATICQQPDGQDIPEDEEKSFSILEMTYDEVAAFDCGSKAHHGFPEQVNKSVSKPLLKDLFPAVVQYCKANNRPLPTYNIEIKSNPDWDNTLTPEPALFVKLVMTVIEQAGVRKQTCIQSFDARSLQAVHELDPDMTTAWLIADQDGLLSNLEELGFLPTIYSPYYKLLSANAVQEAHEEGLKVIPWTVNEVGEMQALIKMGVDGIITDFPNRINQVMADK